MSDLIERQKALDGLKYEMKYGAEMDSYGLDTAYDIIENIPSAESDRKTKVEMNWATYFDTAGVVISHYPYSYKCGNCGCQLKRTYNGKDIHYCPACGYRLEWE